MTPITPFLFQTIGERKFWEVSNTCYKYWEKNPSIGRKRLRDATWELWLLVYHHEI